MIGNFKAHVKFTHYAETMAKFFCKVKGKESKNEELKPTRNEKTHGLFRLVLFTQQESSRWATFALCLNAFFGEMRDRFKNEVASKTQPINISEVDFYRLGLFLQTSNKWNRFQVDL